MRAINVINRYGSIRGAVEAGVLRSGIMYELVRKNVPYVLAGSIRDDGPLPDTEMDLIKAQEEYARLLDGAKMVVCLSSMLHSIGAGNMSAFVGADGLRGHQPGGRHETLRPRLAADAGRGD